MTFGLFKSRRLPMSFFLQRLLTSFFTDFQGSLFVYTHRRFFLEGADIFPCTDFPAPFFLRRISTHLLGVTSRPSFLHRLPWTSFLTDASTLGLFFLFASTTHLVNCREFRPTLSLGLTPDTFCAPASDQLRRAITFCLFLYLHEIPGTSFSFVCTDCRPLSSFAPVSDVFIFLAPASDLVFFSPISGPIILLHRLMTSSCFCTEFRPLFLFAPTRDLFFFNVPTDGFLRLHRLPKTDFHRLPIYLLLLRPVSASLFCTGFRLVILRCFFSPLCAPTPRDLFFYMNRLPTSLYVRAGSQPLSFSTELLRD